MEQDNSYDDTISFLLDAIDYEKISKYKYDASSFNLDRMERLLQEAGNPHCDLKAVHVAGTKGKGSTATVIAAILQEAGLKVGLFTSPHLINLEERIKINGSEISRVDICRVVNVFRPFIERKRKKDLYLSPTFFETLTAIALSYFKEAMVDVAVMEVGLGGRLDSTNIISPLVSIITSIGYDHTDKLGHTLTQIAFEKAGIIKSGVPVVSAPQDDEALSVIEAMCTEKESPLFLVGRDVTVEEIMPVSAGGNCTAVDGMVAGSRFCVTTENHPYREVFIPLPGRHQVINCASAIAAAEIAVKGVCNSTAPSVWDTGWVRAVRASLAALNCPGRIEVIAKAPLVIVDSAHTVESVHALRITIEQYIGARDVTLVLGISQDKNIEGVLDELLPFVASAIFTSTDNPRSADPIELKRLAEERANNKCYAIPDITDAISLAERITDKTGLICITGSTFLAGAARRRLRVT